MKLMTKAIAKLLPALGSNESFQPSETKVPLKLFDPCGRGTWYVMEFDGLDTLFTYCKSPLGEDCDEYGYASLGELQAVKNRLGLGIERDLHWDPNTTLAQVLSGERT